MPPNSTVTAAATTSVAVEVEALHQQVHHQHSRKPQPAQSNTNNTTASTTRPRTTKRVTMCPTVRTTSPSPPEYTDTASSTCTTNKTPSEPDLCGSCSAEPDLELGGNAKGGVTTAGLATSMTTVTATTTSNDDLPRLVLRNRPFHQSSNKVHIQHNQGMKIYSLLKHNWFHVVLRWPTTRSLLTLLSIWTGAILVFAGIYVWYDHLDTSISCGLGKVDDPMTFAAAFAFSLETCTTVGYGLPNGINSYFEQGCSSLQIIIYFQMAWSMIFNAFLITFLYNRLGRSESRSTQVICSRKALVSIVDGQVRFQVRLFDVDAKHPVVEAHVRFYCVMKHRPVPRPLRLLQPDDELGGMLFLSFPTVVNHHIDLYSLLHPPTTASAMTLTPQGLTLRQVDGTTANRDDVICPVCGESYGTLERWKNHVRYQQIVERKDGYPTAGTHLSLDWNQIEQQQQDAIQSTESLQTMKEYFQHNVSEVICVVEGIDPMQSGTFQSLQSYRFEDIVWEEHSQFAPCMTVVENSNDRIFQVDLDRYHDILHDEEAAAAKPKQRRRRVKMTSRRQSDCLFSADVESPYINPKTIPTKMSTVSL